MKVAFQKNQKKERTRKSLFNLFLENISKLLHLTGRAPNTKRLNLKAVGVEVDQTGAVKVTSLLFWYSFCFIQCLWLIWLGISWRIQFIFPSASVCLSVILNYLTLKFHPAVPFSVFWALSWLHAVWTTNSNAELQFFFLKKKKSFEVTKQTIAGLLIIVVLSISIVFIAIYGARLKDCMKWLQCWSVKKRSG